MTAFVSRRTLIWFVGWLLCTVATFSLFANPTTARVDPDEIYWIGSTYYYHLAFEKRDWGHPDWALLPARENPPVAKYVLGLGLALTGRHTTSIDGLGTFYAYFAAVLGVAPGEREHAAKQAAVMAQMNPDLRKRIADTRHLVAPHQLIAPDLLVTARRIMVACAAIASLLLFVLGSSIVNRATGLLASQLLLMHPAVEYSYDHAMSDAPGLMFGAAAALAVWLFAARFLGHPAQSSHPEPLPGHPEPLPGHPERSEGSAPVRGRLREGSARPSRREAVFIALLNGVLLGLACATKMNWLTVAFLFGAAVIVVAFQAWRRGDRTGSTRALACGVGCAVTALLVFALINPTIVRDPVEGLKAVVQQPTLTVAVQARMLATQVHLTTLALKVGAVATMLLISPLVFTVVTIGVLTAGFRARQTGVWFTLAWFGIAFACVVAWIPFEWRRYILPLVIPYALLVSHALVSMVLRQRRSASNAAS